MAGGLARGWASLSCSTVGLGRVLDCDAQLATQLNALVRRSALARSLAVGSASGLAGVEVVLMCLAFLTGRRSSAVRMLAAVGVVYAASELLGRVWKRERPFGELDQVEALVRHVRQRSFPSRHVASGLAMAAIGGRAQPRLGWAMTAVAWVLGVSRVASGLHYPSDVLAGALLGSLVGRFLRESQSGRRTR